MRHVNWIAYYDKMDGYGRYNSYLTEALIREGVFVKTATMDHLSMPKWMQQREGLDWNELTISSLPPNLVQNVPGRHWLLSMVEGTKLPEGWAEKINVSNVERVIVPCHHNAEAFQRSGVLCPISVIPGGTSPKDFTQITQPRPVGKPYTFLTIADRGSRKGWLEVWDAFYLAFGGKTTGTMGVRLIIKSRPKGKANSVVEWMQTAEGKDKRLVYLTEDIEDMREVYSLADAVLLPSYTEGWGMPHREAACMGLPVITQEYAGLDDGYTSEWSIPVEGKIQTIPPDGKLTLGEWQVPDKHKIAEVMKALYRDPAWGVSFGRHAANWIRRNQTWEHSALALKQLIGGEDAKEKERVQVGSARGNVSPERLAC